MKRDCRTAPANDVLAGAVGNDHLAGGGGDDRLNGSRGADINFASGVDHIFLDTTVFAEIEAGPLVATQFRISGIDLA